MDIRKAVRCAAEMLTGNVNRMCVTHDPEELTDQYEYAKQRLETLYEYNSERLEDEAKLREVFRV